MSESTEYDNATTNGHDQDEYGDEKLKASEYPISNSAGYGNQDGEYEKPKEEILGAVPTPNSGYGNDENDEAVSGGYRQNQDGEHKKPNEDSGYGNDGKDETTKENTSTVPVPSSSYGNDSEYENSKEKGSEAVPVGRGYGNDIEADEMPKEKTSETGYGEGEKPKKKTSKWEAVPIPTNDHGNQDGEEKPKKKTSKWEAVPIPMGGNAAGGVQPYAQSNTAGTYTLKGKQQKENWQRIQRTTFTNWINNRLQGELANEVNEFTCLNCMHVEC